MDMGIRILKISISIGISLLFFSSTMIVPIGFTEKNAITQPVELTNKGNISAPNNFDIYYFPEKVALEKYPDLVHNDNLKSEKEVETKNNYQITSNFKNKENPISPLNGPMNSPWPMQGHDIRHTGISQYNTANNYGDEKWRFWIEDWVDCSPVIDDEGTIYFGSYDFHAVYPNGTLKWKYNTIGTIESSAAIDENGVVYVGTCLSGSSLYAIYLNGTLKWKYPVGEAIFSSPAIGNDGSIYFGSENDYIYALYPNGTLKWKYLTSIAVYSSPAIGDDGTIYCGSHDGNLYAFYPNNGTVKWAFHTGSWVHGSPSIGSDGTVYIGSDDEYLYALCHNNGTMKWRLHVGPMYASSAIDENGVLYFGVWNGLFYAVYPNGTVKWSFDLGSQNGVWGSSAAISADGTIYFGMIVDIMHGSGGNIIALNSDGTEKWRKWTGTCVSSPTIAEDGTVYIGSENGNLYAFGIGPLQADADGPHYGLINQPVQFSGSATGGYRPYSWLWNFGDGQTSTLQNPTHSYINPGNYTVTLTVTDDSGNTSSDTSWKNKRIEQPAKHTKYFRPSKWKSRNAI